MSDIRGSDLLRTKWEKGGFLVNEELLKKLIAATADLVIDDILVKGQPKPDFLHASFTIDGDERCGTTVRKILQQINKLGLGRAGRVIVFPKSVPVDKYTIELQLGGH
jgi:hypothetical protein